MTVYVALNAGGKKEIVTLLACPDENDLSTGEKVSAVVECNRVRVNDIVEVDDLPFDRTSFYSFALNINLRVVRVVVRNT